MKEELGEGGMELWVSHDCHLIDRLRHVDMNTPWLLYVPPQGSKTIAVILMIKLGVVYVYGRL